MNSATSRPEALIRNAFPPELLLARAGVAITFGVLAVLWPGPSMAMAAILAGIFLLADGAITIAAARREWAFHGFRNTWNICMLFLGLIEVSLGVIALLSLRSAPITLSIVLGVWAFSAGVLEWLAALLIEKFSVRAPTSSRIYLGLLGVATLMLSFAFLIIPGWSARAVLWAMGLYGILSGAIFWDLGKWAQQQLRVSSRPRLVPNDTIRAA